MARHLKPELNLKLAAWVWVALIVAIPLIIAIIMHFVGHLGEDSHTHAAPAATESAAATSADAAESVESDSATADGAAAAESAPASNTPESDAAQPQGVAGPEDTMILFDTSEAMGAIFAPVSNSLAATAEQLGTQGKQVAVWNYSSPLSPGVTRGYRRNTNFGAADVAANTVIRFGTGGVPQSRSAVVAAIENASAHEAETGNPARVVMVTTGTAQDLDDATFTAAYNAAAQGNVELSVVHVGPGEPDAVLVGVADHVETVPDATNPDNVRAALEKAAGA